MMKPTKFDARWSGETCALYADGELVVSGPWQAFDELTGAMRRVSRGLSKREHAKDIEITASDNHVDIVIGKWRQSATLVQLRQLALALHRVARQAESTNNLVLTQQVADGALLARANLPFGLSDDPRVKDAIANTAAHDRTLRRAIPFATAAKIPGIPKLRHVSNVEALKILQSQHAHMHKDLYGQAS
jgi:hypothetical protein